jgi:hypothetical protein
MAFGAGKEIVCDLAAIAGDTPETTSPMTIRPTRLILFTLIFPPTRKVFPTFYESSVFSR